MSNLLNAYVSNQPTDRLIKQESETSFAYNNKNKVKPMQAKGELLPSRIIGSPIEYAKDLKKDIISIGKGAKGKANDHELGRINDLAMKIGSLALASYLFIKNPLKLSKSMEFVGFGTFFASMALWPKLAIQAPIKAMTGVDIHQKYVDSQGRKKMLYQDPQYDLTDLYSREDLDKIGKKLDIDENIEDRDSHIKQEAKKKAVQGNTLWMMTAGFATPIMSALACNRLEKPINNVIEKVDLASSEKAMKNGKKSIFSRIKQFVSNKSFEKYLSQNSDKALDSETISQLASKIGDKTESPVVRDSIKQELSSLKNSVKIDETFVKDALGGKVSEEIAAMSPEQKALFDKAVENKSFSQIARILSKARGNLTEKQQRSCAGEYVKTLENAKKRAEQPSISQVKDKINALNKNITDYVSDKKLLDRCVDTRVGNKSGTYIANQWGRVSNKLIKSLKLNNQELKAVSGGDMSIIYDKLSKISADDAQFDKIVNDLMKLIGDYEQKTGSEFVSATQSYSSEISTKAANSLKSNGFTKLAEKITAAGKKSTVENVKNIDTKGKIQGAQSSFYRLMQTLDLSKRMKNGNFESQLKSVMQNNGIEIKDETVKKLTQVCKDVLHDATIFDYTEKLTSSKYNLSTNEYKTVMNVLFGESAGSEIKESIKRTMGADKADDILSGFRSYTKAFKEKVANWKNDMTPELERRVTDGITDGKDAVERNNLSGKQIKSWFQQEAKNTYNSRKWLKIFGGAMAALAAATLITDVIISKKHKAANEAETEKKVKNG
ncbi:MAG: hypothetical protein LUH05_06625 [Candidatus Gastranaerophilales bacterium]|nr:hypothetical protein [Candidatus Gastranaerophilales bacterium]